jgi:drug/metabolite transporter (DMT)-like permease
MSAPSERQHAAAAIAMILLSALCLATMDAATKYLSASTPVAFVIWARYTIQAIAMVFPLSRALGRAGFRTRHPVFQVLRGTALATASGLAAFSLRYLPLAEVTAIVMLSPVLVTAASRMMSRDAAGPLRWLLVCGGFLGTLMMVRPGSGAFNPIVVLPLLCMLVVSAYSLLTGRLALLEHPYTTQFYSGVTGSLLSGCALMLGSDGLPGALSGPDWLPVALLLLIGACSTIGHLLLAMAFGRSAPATLMPFTYAQIGFAAILSWAIFDHAPDLLACVGMSTIAACGAMTAWINMRRKPATALEEPRLETTC